MRRESRRNMCPGVTDKTWQRQETRAKRSRRERKEMEKIKRERQTEEKIGREKRMKRKKEKQRKRQEKIMKRKEEKEEEKRKEEKKRKKEKMKRKKLMKKSQNERKEHRKGRRQGGWGSPRLTPVHGVTEDQLRYALKQMAQSGVLDNLTKGEIMKSLETRFCCSLSSRARFISEEIVRVLSIQDNLEETKNTEFDSNDVAPPMSEPLAAGNEHFNIECPYCKTFIVSHLFDYHLQEAH